MVKRILVTGCGSGLGQSLLEQGSMRGHLMVPHYRRNTGIYDVLQGDIGRVDFPDRFEEALYKHNVNVFINNAAVYIKGSILDMADSEIDDVLRTNLSAPMKLLKRAYKFFKEKGKGQIVNINSLTAKGSSPSESVYCASKTGLSAFSKCLQLEAIGTGVEIMDVYPGAMRTRMTSHREDAHTLMSVKEVAAGILDNLDKETYYVNELVLRKRNERSFTA